jgi:hypothetical protein
MPAATADENERDTIRRMASEPTMVRLTKTVQYDLLAHELTKDEICHEVVSWIDKGERVKKVTLRGEHSGQSAFEMKPRINNVLFYLKVTLCELGDPDEEYLLIISVHPDL